MQQTNGKTTLSLTAAISTSVRSACGAVRRRDCFAREVKKAGLAAVKKCLTDDFVTAIKEKI